MNIENDEFSELGDDSEYYLNDSQFGDVINGDDLGIDFTIPTEISDDFN